LNELDVRFTEIGDFMSKQLLKAFLVGVCLLLVTGCTANAATTPTPQPVAATQVIADTPTPIYVYLVVTATPEPATATPEVSSTPTMQPPTNTPIPAVVYSTQIPGAYNQLGTPISSSSSIFIASVQESTTGKAVIKWSATGNFPHGFLVLYSQSIANPYFGGFPYYVVTSTDRSAYIDIKYSTTYYYRLCSYNGSGCDFYSGSYQYTSPAATATP